MRMSYKVEYEQSPWECECCGRGAHERVTVYIGGEKIRSWSLNDQFGGTLSENDLSFPVECADGESFAKGLFTGFFMSGNSVFYEEHKQ